MNAPLGPSSRLPQFPSEGQWAPEGGAQDGSPVLDLNRLIAAFRRRLRLFAAVAVLIFIAVAILTLQSTPRYTATASVMLDPRKEQVVDVTAVLSGLSSESAVVDTEVEIMKSRQLADRVVEVLQLDRDPEFNGALRPPGPVKQVVGGITALFGAAAPEPQRPSQVTQQRQHEAVVDSVLRRLKVGRSGLTYVIKADFTSESPAKAALIANTFADRYLLEQLEAKFDATRQANVWLDERLQELRVQVQDAEAAVEQYKISNNLMSTSGATLTEQEISSYNQQDALARAQLAEDQARLNTARQQLASGSSGDDVGEALGSQVIQQLRAQRAQVSGRVADLQGRYGPRHPEMLKAERELADIDGQIQAEIQRIISNLEAKLQVSRERAGSIQGTLSGARGALAGNNRASVRLRELERNAEAVRTLYESFLNRFKETSTQTDIGQSDARVVSRAKIPNRPSAPNISLNLALGLVLGIGAGLAAAALAHALDSGLATGEEVELRLDAPHLGSIPLLSSVDNDRSASPITHVVDKPLSSFSEAFRNLRASILQSRVGVPIKIIAVTSALPGEGKTTTAVALGRSLAVGGARVVVVDCDLRRRSVNKLLGVDPTDGLLEVLNGEIALERVLHHDDLTDATFLPLSKNNFTPKDVFDSPAMDQLLYELRARFDFVILDTAPVLPVADTRVLAPKADVVVFLARWRKTPEKAIGAALKMLHASGAHIAGVALTQVDMKAQARYGYGDSGYYYGEYKKYYSS
jgi:succinoglycan biosynthesis transport protein ExoP